MSNRFSDHIHPTNFPTPDQDHFNAIAPDYYDMIDSVWYDNGYYHERELSCVVNIVRDLGSAPLRILDAGCGPGRYTVALARLGHKVTAIDYAAKMLETAADLASREGVADNITFIQADVRCLPFCNDCFDIVVCMEVLEHLPGYMDDAAAAIAEFNRVLRQQGILIVEAPLIAHETLRNKHAIFRASWKEVPPRIWDAYKRAPLKTWHHFTTNQLSSLLAASGLSPTALTFIRVVPGGLIERCPSLVALDQVLEHHPSSQPLAREVIYVARKGPSPTRGAPAPAYTEATQNIENCLLYLADLATRAEQSGDPANSGAAVRLQEQQLHSLKTQIEVLTADLHRERSRFDAYFLEKEGYIASLKRQLRLSEWLGPALPLARWLVRRVRHILTQARPFITRALPSRLRFLLEELRRDGHDYASTASTVVYYQHRNPFPLYPLCRRFDPNSAQHVPVSLVTTTKNEKSSVQQWCDSLICQTKLPSEVIIVDSGSTDGTYEALQAIAPRMPFPVRIIQAAGCNIAQGRNIGIESASHSIIVVTDFGCELQPDWLQNITAPFSLDNEIDVVAGWYVPRSPTLFGIAAAIELVPHISQVNPEIFVASSRSLAFRKQIWKTVDGYPEHLTATAEDTLFSLELRRRARRWAFVPEALVFWHAPTSILAAIRKAYLWSFGDGEAALFPGRYLRLMWCALMTGLAITCLVAATFWPLTVTVGRAALPVALLMAFLYTLTKRKRSLSALIEEGHHPFAIAAWATFAPLLQVARATGFVAGAMNRPTVYKRCATAESRVVFLLSGLPFTDSGGGQRATQLAREFMRRGDVVVFVSKFPSYESRRVNVRTYYPNLLVYRAHAFNVATFFRRYSCMLAGRELLTVVEFPLPEYLTVAKQLKARNSKVVYDLIDDWNTSLGASWYKPEIERELSAESDVLVATAPILQTRLEAISGRPVHLLPNAVDVNSFDRAQEHDRPIDLPAGRTILTYVGALWGSWFDWTLVRRLGLAYPEASIVLIGDATRCPQDLPSNVHILGLKAQTEIPAYLAHTHVAIIPWVRNDLTNATSPLKVYEYIAMGKPVVAPALDTLRDLPYVLLSLTHDDFVDNIRTATTVTVDPRVVDQFLAQNSWKRRVDTLLSLAFEGDRAPCGNE